MKGDPAADANANGGDLVSATPHAGQAFALPGFEAVTRQGLDQHVLQAADIDMDISPVARQDQDGVADELARPVKRHLPSPADPMDWNAAGIEHKALVRPASQGKDGRVFKQQKPVLTDSMNPQSPQHHIA